jgi:hypothetical protein
VTSLVVLPRTAGSAETSFRAAARIRLLRPAPLTCADSPRPLSKQTVDEAFPAEDYVLAKMPVTCKHGATPAGSPETLSSTIRSSHVFDVSRHASGSAAIGPLGVTTTALAQRTRADTNAGLGTVDDVRLASRQKQHYGACSPCASGSRRGH